MASGMPLQPTYQGFINTTLDALVVFEACLSGQLNHVPRRPHDRERQDLIRSGNIFVYEEHASGIKRWTDSISWSPSRILGNYLLYRELDKPFPPGEKKRARGKKGTSQPGGVTKSQPSQPSQPSRPRSSVSYGPGMEQGAYGSSVDDEERALVGSLVDSYDFKAGGLIKKTLSITYNGVPHHLVSYYTVEDVKSQRLVSPTNDQKLRGIIPRTELMSSQNFRAPVEDIGSYNGITPNSLYHPTMPTPDFESGYTLQGGIPGGHGLTWGITWEATWAVTLASPTTIPSRHMSISLLIISGGLKDNCPIAKGNTRAKGCPRVKDCPRVKGSCLDRSRGNGQESRPNGLGMSIIPRQAAIIA
ncbi:hypothetical protein F53441_6244 [Fusarium austroafricanum]|uniref:Global transcription regulator sge1 n=1 Tax=Fusarium austroafricanum TaxID=2364996 RepID=A0A8H4KJX3_9HYPO|nr:hypothetical protein F53441_6244 [Fusarium austroafricanum]